MPGDNGSSARAGQELDKTTPQVVSENPLKATFKQKILYVVYNYVPERISQKGTGCAEFHSSSSMLARVEYEMYSDVVV